MVKHPRKKRATKPTVGLWLIGAAGSVGSTVALGLAAMRRELTPSVGLVSALPEFKNAGLVDVRRMCIGGHEIRSTSILDAVRESLAVANLFSADLIEKTATELRSVQREVVPGTLWGAGPTVQSMANRRELVTDRNAADAVERLAADMDSFRRRKRLDTVVVINVASSEPPPSKNPALRSYERLEPKLHRASFRALPCSAVYALAALKAGCPYVNFTPSPALSIPAVRDRADQLNLPYMGSDGKTGESLVKSFLAPMFAWRNLHVMSWLGQNYLGNRDGAVLNDPKTRASKIRSKDRILGDFIGNSTTTAVGIDYVPSLSDWKLAWDFVHFEGFLNTKMSLQFSWHGSDSALAAPLVLDLARFAALEMTAGHAGPMRHLACFFKDPLDVKENGYHNQWRLLLNRFDGSVGAGRSRT